MVGSLGLRSVQLHPVEAIDWPDTLVRMNMTCRKEIKRKKSTRPTVGAYKLVFHSFAVSLAVHSCMCVLQAPRVCSFFLAQLS